MYDDCSLWKTRSIQVVDYNFAFLSDVDITLYLFDPCNIINWKEYRGLRVSLPVDSAGLRKTMVENPRNIDKWHLVILSNTLERINCQSFDFTYHNAMHGN